MSSWANQGVLLLNSVLTVEDSQPGIHSNLGWETFTDKVIHKLGEEEDIVFGEHRTDYEFCHYIHEEIFGRDLDHIKYKLLKDEFHKRFEFTMEEMEKNLENEINAQMIKNEKNELLNEISILKANNIAFEIGKRVKQDDILRSPYESLRELILEQTDFTKKQNDICNRPAY